MNQNTIKPGMTQTTIGLQIGNYFMYDRKLVYLSSILKDNCVGIYDGNGLDKSLPMECLRPIEITYEWLDRLGFEKTYTSNVRTRFDLIENTKIGYDFNNYGEADGLEGFRFAGNYFASINQVHQLQNLHYAMTGNILKTK